MDFFLQRLARILITTSATYKVKVDIKVKVVDRVNGGTSPQDFFTPPTVFTVFSRCVTV